MSKALSVSKEWEFVSKGTEISLGKFVSEYCTPITLDSWSSVVSTEDTDEIWRDGKVFLAQQARWMGDKQENEEDHSPGVQKDF